MLDNTANLCYNIIVKRRKNKKIISIERKDTLWQIFLETI